MHNKSAREEKERFQSWKLTALSPHLVVRILDILQRLVEFTALTDGLHLPKNQPTRVSLTISSRFFGTGSIGIISAFICALHPPSRRLGIASTQIRARLASTQLRLEHYNRRTACCSPVYNRNSICVHTRPRANISFVNITRELVWCWLGKATMN